MMIKELLDTRIRPTVQEDGGDITFMSFKDGIVSLRMQVNLEIVLDSMFTLKKNQFYLENIHIVSIFVLLLIHLYEYKRMRLNIFLVGHIPYLITSLNSIV